MNSDNFNKWLTLGANIAVVVGIFALIAELNHSSKIAEVAAYQARSTEIQESQVQFALSPDLAELLVNFRNNGVDSLSEAEADRVRAWYRAVMLRMQAQYFQYQQGFLAREIIEGTLDASATGTYERWEELGILDTLEIPEWRAEIEQRIGRDSEP